MAKLSVLQITNRVLANLGETSNLSVLTSLSGISLLVFNTINEALYDLAFEERWKPLEERGTIALHTATTTYTKTSNLYDYDRDSFVYDNQYQVTYRTPQEMSRRHPVNTSTGEPLEFMEWEGAFEFYPLTPSASAHSKNVAFRYWKLPTILETATPAGTCWVPEGFDITLLVDLVTYKILHYKHNEEAGIYHAKVYGPGGQGGGSMDKMKHLWRSPELVTGNMVVEPM